MTSKKSMDDKKRAKAAPRQPKSRVELVSSIESFSDSNDENSRKATKVHLDVFNSDLVFAEILNKANKEP